MAGDGGGWKIPPALREGQRPCSSLQRMVTELSSRWPMELCSDTPCPVDTGHFCKESTHPPQQQAGACADQTRHLPSRPSGSAHRHHRHQQHENFGKSQP